eukprot:scaffold19860_cov72-Phaeocystis_antarctica.AAC.1
MLGLGLGLGSALGYSRSARASARSRCSYLVRVRIRVRVKVRVTVALGPGLGLGSILGSRWRTARGDCTGEAARGGRAEAPPSPRAWRLPRSIARRRWRPSSGRAHPRRLPPVPPPSAGTALGTRADGATRCGSPTGPRGRWSRQQ